MDWYNKFLWQKSMAWVNKDKKLAYRNIGKNASSSIKRALEPVGFRRSQEYSDSNGYFSFTVIREPIDRFVSGFLTVISNETSRKQSGGEYHNFLFQYSEIEPLLKGFIRQIEIFGFFDDHILPQKYTISDVNGMLHKIDAFILFERLQKDFVMLKNMIVENIELQHVNKIDEYRYFPLKRDSSLSSIKEKIKDLICKDKTPYSLFDKLKRLYIEDFMLYEYVEGMNR